MDSSHDVIHSISYHLQVFRVIKKLHKQVVTSCIYSFNSSLCFLECFSGLTYNVLIKSIFFL